MSNSIIDVSAYWDADGKLDTSQAFKCQEDAVRAIARVAKTISAKHADFKSMVRSVCEFIREGHFKKVGKTVKIREAKCEIVAALPDGKYLVLAERHPVCVDRVHRRIGDTVYPSKLATAKLTQDITSYWRKDNTVSRRDTFDSVSTAIAYIRRSAEENRESANKADAAKLLAIANTCLAIEHDYFQLIGNDIRTNERKPGANTGPLPKDGKVVAILDEGQALAVSSKSRNGQRYGFIVGRKRMAQIIREMQ